MSVEEEFEKVMWKEQPLVIKQSWEWLFAFNMYLAGRADERKRCVEIAQSYYTIEGIAQNIVTAIERQEG